MAVVSIAVVATLAEAAGYRELVSVAADLPQSLPACSARTGYPAAAALPAPSVGTLWRMLIELDADELDAAVGAWLHKHASP